MSIIAVFEVHPIQATLKSTLTGEWHVSRVHILKKTSTLTAFHTRNESFGMVQSILYLQQNLLSHIGNICS